MQYIFKTGLGYTALQSLDLTVISNVTVHLVCTKYGMNESSTALVLLLAPSRLLDHRTSGRSANLSSQLFMEISSNKLTMDL